MQAHDIEKPEHLRTHRRVGRGGKRGTFSGRGVKGQKSRAGHGIRPQIWDYIARIPKLRGFERKTNVSKFGKATKSITPTFAINVSELAKISATEITPAVLVQNKIVDRYKGKLPRVKILGNGELTKSIVVSGMSVSEGAREKIEKAGGSVKE